MPKLSPAMNRAYELLIERRLANPNDPILAAPFDPVKGRYVSAATMTALMKRRVINLHKVVEVKTETRSRNGNYNTSRHYEATYTFP